MTSGGAKLGPPHVVTEGSPAPGVSWVALGTELVLACDLVLAHLGITPLSQTQKVESL